MIVVRLNGGLGNQLFQYGFARSLAYQKQTSFALDVRYLNDRSYRPFFTFREYDLSIFNVQVNFYKSDRKLLPFWVYADRVIAKMVEKFPSPTFFGTYVESDFSFNAGYINLPADCYCIGYFQSYKYLEPVKHLLVKDLSFSEKQTNPAVLHLIQEIQQLNSVCVHIRKGDFANNNVHGTIGLEYYTNAIDLMAQKVNDIHLFVFSDDVNWCAKNLQFQYPVTFVPTELAGVKTRNNFEMMTHCKHFVISNSTYAWWAAYLAQYATKTVIAPKKWFMGVSVDTKDLTPAEWILL
jgi:hypothetical protein